MANLCKICLWFPSLSILNKVLPLPILIPISLLWQLLQLLQPDVRTVDFSQTLHHLSYLGVQIILYPIVHEYLHIYKGTVKL